MTRPQHLPHSPRCLHPKVPLSFSPDSGCLATPGVLSPTGLSAPERQERRQNETVLHRWPALWQPDFWGEGGDRAAIRHKGLLTSTGTTLVAFVLCGLRRLSLAGSPRALLLHIVASVPFVLSFGLCLTCGCGPLIPAHLCHPAAKKEPGLVEGSPHLSMVRVLELVQLSPFLR